MMMSTEVMSTSKNVGPLLATIHVEAKTNRSETFEIPDSHLFGLASARIGWLAATKRLPPKIVVSPS